MGNIPMPQTKRLLRGTCVTEEIPKESAPSNQQWPEEELEIPNALESDEEPLVNGH